eukprot:scaffold1778_cov63-Cyclotella_meneghiniana.AAC.2
MRLTGLVLIPAAAFAFAPAARPPDNGAKSWMCSGSICVEFYIETNFTICRWDDSRTTNTKIISSH